MTEPDWERLRSEALAVAERAYAPYSGLRVGAAAVTESGTIVTGCNVENSCYPVGTCRSRFVAATNRVFTLTGASLPTGTTSPVSNARNSFG